MKTKNVITTLLLLALLVISNDYKITFDDVLMDGHDVGSIAVRVNI